MIHKSVILEFVSERRGGVWMYLVGNNLRKRKVRKSKNTFAVQGWQKADIILTVSSHSQKLCSPALNLLLFFDKTNVFNTENQQRPEVTGGGVTFCQTGNTNKDSTAWLVVKQTSSNTQTPLQITARAERRPRRSAQQESTKQERLTGISPGNEPFPQWMSREFFVTSSNNK